MDQKDLKQIKELFSEEFDLQEKRLDKKFDEKLDLQEKRLDKKLALRDEKLERKLALMIKAEMDIGMGKMEQKMFDWKSEIVDVVDGLAKEIRDEREFRDVSGHRIADNTRRIEKLEKKTFGVVEVSA